MLFEAFNIVSHIHNTELIPIGIGAFSVERHFAARASTMTYSSTHCLVHYKGSGYEGRLIAAVTLDGAFQPTMYGVPDAASPRRR